MLCGMVLIMFCLHVVWFLLDLLFFVSPRFLPKAKSGLGEELPKARAASLMAFLYCFDFLERNLIVYKKKNPSVRWE